MRHRNLTLDEAWALLGDDPSAVLIDVRTPEEWTLVGVPVLDRVGKTPRLVTWTRFGTGERNPDFAAEAFAGLDPATPMLFLCRSGVRSAAAAELAVDHGFATAYNVTAGFEGDLGPDGHRGGGWKHHGLPWRQG